MERRIWWASISIYIKIMLKEQKNPFCIVVCEGTSEVAYIRELNKFLREQEAHKMFIDKKVGTGDYHAVVKKYREVKKQNLKSHIEIWVDYDRYCRNDNHNEDDYADRNVSKIPNFLFNYHSFEDFFVMHYDDEVLNRWQGHFVSPLKSDMAESLLRQHLFPEYAKSSLLPDFVVSKEGLRNLFRHQQSQNCRFKSDFAAFLMKELQGII